MELRIDHYSADGDAPSSTLLPLSLSLRLLPSARGEYTESTRMETQRMATSGVAASICNDHSSMVARLACGGGTGAGREGAGERGLGGEGCVERVVWRGLLRWRRAHKYEEG